MHLVQISDGKTRRVAIVEGAKLKVLREVDSVLALVEKSFAAGRTLSDVAQQLASDEVLNYDAVYEGRSEWKLLVPVDCPGEPQRVLVSGTGLTHLGSARDRQAMHSATVKQEAEMTDSMKMFEWGRQGGRPAAGDVGVAPEWFYKGDGSALRGPFEALEIPAHAEDGGEEAELAAIYYVSPEGTPWRIGMATGNEFSDHVFERRNYLNLAGSKLRTCSLGPELAVDAAFEDVPGSVRLWRDGRLLWEKAIRTGERNMCHSLANLEHHHFKFAGHRQGGQLHVHFLGADSLSFGEGIRLKAGDTTEVQFEGYGRPLKNVVTRDESKQAPVTVRAMR
jgi:hypothetical protein